MANDVIERLRYYEHQYLGALDFEDEQAYHRDMRRRHNLGLHTWGIVVGLELEERDPVSGGSGPIEIYIKPGVALDGFGRELVVLEPFQIPPDPRLFQGLNAAGYVPVYITYAQDQVRQPAPGWQQCETDSQYGRVLERFRVVVGTQASLHSDVLVGGETATVAGGSGSPTIPPDEAVPYQDLPADDADPLPRWLVRLGSVNWDGTPGQRVFLTNDAAQLNEERRYVASVAAELLAPADTLRIRKRWTASDPTKETDDFAAVEGELRVDGVLTARDSVRLEAGTPEFREEGGGTTPPLEMYRNAEAGLRIRLGDDDAGDTTLEVGIKDASSFEAKVTVNDKGEVDTKGRVDVSGHVLLNERLEIRDAQGGTDTDPLWIERNNRGTNQNDLRLVIGDDQAGDDQLLVGPIYYGDGQFKEKFAVVNDGSVRTAGNTTIGAGGDAILRTRHVYGKGSGNDGDDVLYLQWANGQDVQVGGGTTGSAPKSGLHVVGDAVVGYGGYGRLRLRHVDGKDWQSDDLDDLYLQWDTDKDVVIGSSGHPSSLSVSGNLHVDGTTNAVVVKTYDLAKENSGNNTETAWTVDHTGTFAAVYAKFAVLRGFSLWPHADELVWSPGEHDPNNSVQHMYVRVDEDTDVNTTTGVCYVSENDASVEYDNTALFTVVVVGRGA